MPRASPRTTRKTVAKKAEEKLAEPVITPEAVAEEKVEVKVESKDEEKSDSKDEEEVMDEGNADQEETTDKDAADEQNTEDHDEAEQEKDEDKEEVEEEANDEAEEDETKAEEGEPEVIGDEDEEANNAIEEEMEVIDLVEGDEDDKVVVDVDEDDKIVVEGDEESKKDAKDESDKAEKIVKKPWVAIVQAEEGTLYGELQKIGKLISRQTKVNEIKRKAKKHRMRVFPITLDELNTPFIRGILEMCSQVQMKWVTKRTDEAITLNGILEMTFNKEKDAEEQRSKLKSFKKDISVWEKYDINHEEETNRKFNKMVGIPVDADTNNKLTLLSPSLPESVTEEELWQLFPNAREIWLITGGKRNHAYLKFLDEETLQKTLDKLTELGPPRDDFNFCRLVRYYEVEHAIKYTRGGIIRRPARRHSRSPKRDRKSSPSHKEASRTADKSKTSDKSSSQSKSDDKPTDKKSSDKSSDDKKSDDKSSDDKSNASTSVTEDKPESSPEAKSDVKTSDSTSNTKSSNADDKVKAADSTAEVKPVDSKAEKSTDSKTEVKAVDSKAAVKTANSKQSSTSESKPDDKKAKSDSKDSKPAKRPFKSRFDSDHSKSDGRSSARSSASRDRTQRSPGYDSSKSRDRTRTRSRDRDLSRGRDRPRGQDRSNNRDDRVRRRPDKERVIIPFRGRDRSPIRHNNSSILGPPPLPVPSLLNPAQSQVNRPLENVFSQLQRPMMPTPPVNNMQRQQGLQVLDSLLSTIGKLSGRPAPMANIPNPPMVADDRFINRATDRRRSRSRSPVPRPMSPVKRRRGSDHSREDIFPRDDYTNTSQQDTFGRSAEPFMSTDFNRSGDFSANQRRDDFSGGFDRQYGHNNSGSQGMPSMPSMQTTDRAYDPHRDTVQYGDQRNFSNTDQRRIARPPDIQTNLTQAISHAKKETEILEGEYALMMNQLGHNQQPGVLGQIPQRASLSHTQPQATLAHLQQQQQPNMGATYRPDYY